MATDGHHWFFSWQYGLEITDNHFNSILRNSSIEPPLNVTPGIPADLLAQGLNHIGDIDYHDGIIYASLDSTAGFMNGHVALYNAADLSYTGVTYSLSGAPSNPKHDIASWVAVDGLHNRGYGKEYQLGNTINVYRLDSWTFDHVVTLDTALERIQGAKLHGEWLYMSSDNSTHSVYRANLRTGHVEELFRLPTPAGHLEVEGIALRAAHEACEGRRPRVARDCEGREGPEDAVDIYVEMVVNPDNSGVDLSNPDVHVSLFHYRARGRDL
jgi:hypothetical protein